MKVTLSFDLPDEKDELMTALHADRYCSVLIDMDAELRARLKYCANENPEELTAFLQELRDTLNSDLEHTNWRE